MYCVWHRLRNLRRLVLRGNSLKRLPRLLARLPALQALDLSYNADLEVSHADVPSSLPFKKRGAWDVKEELVSSKGRRCRALSVLCPATHATAA